MGARELGLDMRGLHFARDVRKQLANMMANGADSRLHIPHASAAFAKQIAEDRREGAVVGVKRKRQEAGERFPPIHLCMPAVVHKQC